MNTVTVDSTGKVELPKEALEASAIQPGTELLVLVEAGKLVLLDRHQVRQRMAAVDQRIRERLHRSLLSHPDAPFFGGLTIKEYLALSDEEERALWERENREVEKELQHVPEMDVPAHFVSAGQRSVARGVARRRSSH
ncbi:AbrB/MazE/SpoVT family DNA-binding domain-containing protein [Candidatus Poribacteria bacterium]|nr:AbrB/MazE/SpoVT family DNA-binding domain-containing protein [Candidatus Poribacteria bacterium]